MKAKTEKRWYVVCDDCVSTDPDEPVDNRNVWTVSLNPDRTGWTTDSGYDGYGLTKEQAQELADAANEKWASRR